MPQPETSRARSPHEALAAYHRAMLDKSADDLADLYAADAVHEFPFTAPGFPPRYEGREAVRTGYRAVWGASPVRIDEVRTVSAYGTDDPEVIVAEHVVAGTLPATGAAFTVPGLLVLRVRDGLITHVRDYMDTAALAAARG
ncbi:MULTISPECIES: nuclear transport factor 2 family protein [unclassified Streptomyces]|uniref:nuclear transport factor 2 family protein n=1 Tax=unclassified Streptomyces TaxID=2593676 RepID=UPI002E818C8C|nr:nuclear transport factor 2 family protein [Streptomyces sp. NBC_00523]WUC99012.1 nuclear transport factor 2 family protein [Streptomyces sp. NBC_00523]